MQNSNAAEKAPPGGSSIRRRLGLTILGAALAPLALAGLGAVVARAAGRDAGAVPFVLAALLAPVAAWVAAGRVARQLRSLSDDLRRQSTAALESGVRARTGVLEAARAELEERSRRGEEGDRLKSLFIANMSHEIRTPLNSVLALSQLLRDGIAGPLVADQRRYLEVIERNGQNLLRLINDILDLSRIEAGHLEMDLQDVWLASVVDEVVESLLPFAAAKDLELAIRLPADLPPIRCDVDRLRQILTNLVGNAIKFTDAGMVQVTAEARGDEVGIQVIDTGVGIPSPDQGRIFQEFFQVDQTLARRQGGTGLGLAIASRLAGLMAGELSVSSIVGSGSRFTLTLPRAEVRSEAAGDARGRVLPPRRAPARDGRGEGEGTRARPIVLLVEDNEDNLFTLRQVLGRLPLELLTATGGRQAIEICRRQLPDLIVMDVQMPGMSGLQATGAIRALPGGPEVAIIALTAQAMKGDRERILSAGFDEYLSKPVQPKALVEMVERLLGGLRDASAGRTGAPVAAPQGDKRDGAHPPRR